MALAGSSIAITPGSGETVATNTISSKKHQVIMLADSTGNIEGSRPVYFMNIPTAVHVAAASTLMVDIFNADSTLLVRVLSIQHIVNLETAVTGVGFEWQLLRTTAVGTGGTAITAWLPDTSQTALSANITCRSKATGGATASTSLRWYYTNSEETLAGNQLAGGAMRSMDIVPQILNMPLQQNGILLRQNQGLRINQETNSAAGNSAWLVAFTVE